MKNLSILFFVASVGIIANAFGDSNPASGVPETSTTSAKAVPTTEPNDKGDWKGNLVKLANDVTSIEGPGGEKKFYAPDGAIFTVTADNPQTHQLTVKFRKIPPKNTEHFSISDPQHWDMFGYQPSSDTQARTPSGSVIVNLHDLYKLDKAAVEEIDYYRHGWAFSVCFYL